VTKSDLLLLVIDMENFLNRVCRHADKLIEQKDFLCRGKVAEAQYQSAQELIARARKVSAC
jgi:hypothetical protein